MNGLVFVLSLLLSFTLFFFFLSPLLKSTLFNAGYDVSRIILPDHQDSPSIMTVLDTLDLVKSPAVIFTAVIIATSAAYKFLYPGQSIFQALDIYSPLPRTSQTPRPHELDRFPLGEEDSDLPQHCHVCHFPSLSSLH